MSAHPIGTVTLSGDVTCNLCPWSIHDRIDPAGALGAHRDEAHPNARPPARSDAPAASRHMPGVVLGAALMLVFGALTWHLWDLSGWWILAAGPTALMAALGAYGITSDAQRVPRDGRGRRTR